MKTTNVTEKAFAGNPHARLDEGEVASAMPRRGSLHYNMKTRMVAFVAAAVVVARLFAVTSVTPHPSTAVPGTSVLTVATT